MILDMVSPPSRGAWIEMFCQMSRLSLMRHVAPLAGGVD